MATFSAKDDDDDDVIFARVSTQRAQKSTFGIRVKSEGNDPTTRGENFSKICLLVIIIRGVDAKRAHTHTHAHIYTREFYQFYHTFTT